MNMDVKKRRQRRIKQINPQQSWQEWRVPPTRNQFIYKCFISLILYILIWTIFQLEHSYAQRTQQAIRGVMNDSFDYKALTSWYQAHIGTIPTLLPIFHERSDGDARAEYSSPVSGQPMQGVADQADIIQVHTSADRTVTAIGKGLVQSIAPSNRNGMTVRVLHTNGILAIYGGLESVQVVKNDWLEEGALIGYTNILYFALKKGDQYVNPGDVIPFD
ncbi:MAG: M23 family metallopeptidase [Paenibacillaceae bacterium]